MFETHSPVNVYPAFDWGWPFETNPILGRHILFARFVFLFFFLGFSEGGGGAHVVQVEISIYCLKSISENSCFSAFEKSEVNCVENNVVLSYFPHLASHDPSPFLTFLLQGISSASSSSSSSWGWDFLESELELHRDRSDRGLIKRKSGVRWPRKVCGES